MLSQPTQILGPKVQSAAIALSLSKYIQLYREGCATIFFNKQVLLLQILQSSGPLSRCKTKHSIDGRSCYGWDEWKSYKQCMMLVIKKF